METYGTTQVNGETMRTKITTANIGGGKIYRQETLVELVAASGMILRNGRAAVYRRVKAPSEVGSAETSDPIYVGEAGKFLSTGAKFRLNLFNREKNSSIARGLTGKGNNHDNLYTLRGARRAL